MAENDVFVVQPLRLHRANEKLGSVGVGPGVGHGKNARFGVLELKILVLELVAENALSTTTISPREIASLAHELGNDAMEARPFVSVGEENVEMTYSITAILRTNYLLKLEK